MGTDKTSESAPVDAVVMRLESWIGSELQQPSWDSYGSVPITTETIRKAIDLAKLVVGKIDKVNWVTPCPDGSIEFSDNDNSIWIRVSMLNESV
jgi:hypothetical protein